MRRTFALAIATALIASSASGAMAATSRANQSGHGHPAYRTGTIPAVPYGARNAFGAMAGPMIGEGCALRPFARDCDKRGPWERRRATE